MSMPSVARAACDSRGVARGAREAGRGSTGERGQRSGSGTPRSGRVAESVEPSSLGAPGTSSTTCIAAWASGTWLEAGVRRLRHRQPCVRRQRCGGELETGGWGHVLGDEGSGYWLGLHGMKAALRYATVGPGPRSSTLPSPSTPRGGRGSPGARVRQAADERESPSLQPRRSRRRPRQAIEGAPPLFETA